MHTRGFVFECGRDENRGGHYKTGELPVDLVRSRDLDESRDLFNHWIKIATRCPWAG